MKINPKHVEKLMKQMGMQPTEIEADEVVIRAAGREIVIRNPQVVRISVMGNDTFQISGTVEEHNREEASGDIRLIMEKTGTGEGRAKKALEAAGGDIAQAIIRLKKSGS